MDGAIRELVATRLGIEIGRVEVVGAGLDNAAYLVNGALVVRVAKNVEAGEVEREGRLLEVVKAVSPVRVPEPVIVDDASRCLAYWTVPGVPLIGLPSATIDVAPLAELLRALHATPIELFNGLVEVDSAPLDEWLAEAAETYDAVRTDVPATYHAAIESFLTAEPPSDPTELVFSHNDLGIEHVLVDPASYDVTGVIDWTDAALVDRACDVGLLYRDLGPAALATVLDHYGPADDAIAERARFYARCSMFEDLAYGLENHRHLYVDKSLRALEWLFS